MAVTAPLQSAAADNQLAHLEDAVSLKEGLDAAHIQMLAICQKALPGWEQLTAADVEFSTVSGGISNINAKLTPKQQQLGLAPVMFKVFGEKTEKIINRAAEKVVVVALGKQGFGPKVLALFANGRIEEWLDCCGITPQEMCSPRFIPRIARQLCCFHALDVDVPKAPHTPWGVIADWLAQAKQLQFRDPGKKAAYEQIDFSALEGDIADTQEVCALTQSPIVFGHNDLLSGNILVLQQPGFDPQKPNMDGPICIIDYEYGGYTYRGFDIGNHFTEYAGFEGDYSRYPSKQQQELFFRHYLAQGEQLAAAHEGLAAETAAAADDADTPVAPDTLDRLSAEANAWALASHLYWGIWAIIQACYSPIDFDYLEFGHTRLGEFKRRKADFLDEARRVFGEGTAAAAAAAPNN